MIAHDDGREPGDGCVECPLGSRRDFLRDAALIAAALTVASVGAPELATAERMRGLAVRFGEGRRTGVADVTYPIPADDGATIDTTNQVILVRFEGAVFAFNLSCPHQNTALRWNADEKMFQCPKHKSRYKPDGTFISGRATRGMDRLAIRRQDASVVVDVDSMFKQDEDRAGWDGAVVKV
jgi:Rieske Fe-S protein